MTHLQRPKPIFTFSYLFIQDSESGLWDPSSPVINNRPADDSMNHNPNASNSGQM